MKKNGIGGANTKTGSIFEGKTDLQTFLCAQKGYSCKKNDSGWIDVFYNEKQVASIFKKKDYFYNLGRVNLFFTSAN